MDIATLNDLLSMFNLTGQKCCRVAVRSGSGNAGLSGAVAVMRPLCGLFDIECKVYGEINAIDFVGYE